jgi:hypothetical protein
MMRNENQPKVFLRAFVSFVVVAFRVVGISSQPCT